MPGPAVRGDHEGDAVGPAGPSRIQGVAGRDITVGEDEGMHAGQSRHRC